MQIFYITGNDYKFKIAQTVLQKAELTLVQKNLETPEIQSTSVEEVAKFSARWASEQLQHSVALTDAGCFISALNGFPGPFVKYTNQWFSASDYLRLMEGKQDRSVSIKACLAYCEPRSEPMTFTFEAKGRIALEAGPKGTTSINEIFIPDGFQEVESALPRETMIDFWSQHEQYWQALANYLLTR